MKKLDRTFWPELSCDCWMKQESKPGLVSVIIPTYNRQNYILEAINSVFDQTYRPIELIVIDDGSTDGTSALISKWVQVHDQSDDFVLRYYWQENKGVSAARNHGLVISEGEYIQFLDSDDLLLQDRLSKCVRAMNENGVELLHSAHYLDYGLDVSEHPGRGLVISGPANMGKVPDPRFYIWTAACFFLRKVIYQAGPWNETLRICEDAEYFSRVFAIADSAFAISEPLVIKRKHGDQRLLDVQKEYSGLENRYRCLELRERIIESCGYESKDLLGGWLQLSQDALAFGFSDLCRKSLTHSKEMCQHTKILIQWHLINVLSYLPRPFSMLLWPAVNSVRNNLKWYRDLRRGKIKRASKVKNESNAAF